MPQLAVITGDGSVFGSKIVGTDLEPVFQLSAAKKIGFNPQDRFIVTIGNTLAVITNTGDVFGAPIEFSSGTFGFPSGLGPIFQLSGAKIGFNPQDRFMVTIGGNILAVITNTGDVFGAEVQGQTIGPIFQFSGAKIGFNPQDRFMVAFGHEIRGNTLAVITNTGDVFGAEVQGQTIGPIFQFSGAKIGFNPQDRFMVTINDNILAVITNTGDVFGAPIEFSTIPAPPGGFNTPGPPTGLSPIFQFSGAKIGFNPQDRFMVALSDKPQPPK